jgi:hypothetical protein
LGGRAEKADSLGWILSIHPWDILNSTILLTIILIVIWMELQHLYPEELKSLSRGMIVVASAGNEGST